MIKRICQWIIRFLSGLWGSPFSVQYLEDPIDNLKNKVLYIIGTTGFPWQVEMLCPCGCEVKIILPVNYEMSPRWNLTVNSDNLPTLHPSVHRTKGCRSHFFLKHGKIEWVD